MAKLEDVREETSVAEAAANEATGVPVACEVAAPPIAEVEPAALPIVEPAVEAATPEAKMPPAPQLAEPACAVAPPFRREGESRPITARPAAPSGIEARKAPPAPAKEKTKSRFPLLAATLALAAGLGGAAGAVGIPALLNYSIGPSAAAAPTTETIAEVQTIKGLVAQLSTELGAIKTTLEQSTKLTVAQFGKVAERLDRTERGQAEPTAKLGKISEALERLERRVAQTPAAAQADVTGSVAPPHPPAAEAKPKPTIIEDYVVRKVFDGVALVEGRRGIIEVEPGTTLPGAGRVEEIRRQDGRWVVVTTKGLIVPAR